MQFCLGNRNWLVLMLVFPLGLSSCHRRISTEEKSIRHELQNALREGSYEKADQLARRVLQFAPNDNGAWDRLVQAQFGRRDLKGAKQTVAAWRKTVRKPSRKLDEYAGDIASTEKDLSLAVQSWKAALQADPRNSRVIEKLARAQEKQRRWDESEAAWTRLLKGRLSATSFLHRAIVRRHLHRWAEAQEDLHHAEELAPKDPEVVAWAKHFAKLSKFVAEIRDLDAQLAVAPKDEGLLADRALLFLRSEDSELALEDSAAALKLAPWAVRPRLFAGIALIKLGRAAEVEKIPVRSSLRLESLTPEFLETVSRLDAEISVERKNAELYVARAWQLNEIGQSALALHDAETAVQMDSKSAPACVEQSYALMKLGRADDSFAQIKRATELDPTSGAAWEYRGELEMRREEFASAIESFTRALSITTSIQALERRAECYRRSGAPDKADADRRELAKLGAPETK